MIGGVQTFRYYCICYFHVSDFLKNYIPTQTTVPTQSSKHRSKPVPLMPNTTCIFPRLEWGRFVVSTEKSTVKLLLKQWLSTLLRCVPLGYFELSSIMGTQNGHIQKNKMMLNV